MSNFNIYILFTKKHIYAIIMPGGFMQLKMNRSGKINLLYKRVQSIINSYISSKEVSVKYNVDNSINSVKKELSKSNPDRKILVLTELINKMEYYIDTDTDPNQMVPYLRAWTSCIKRDLGPGKSKNKLEELILEEEDFLINYDKDSLINIEKSYISRLRDASHFFNKKEAIPYTIAAFDAGFYGYYRTKREAKLKEVGINIKQGERLSDYLDIEALRFRVAALSLAENYLTDFAKKYNLKNALKSFSEKEKLDVTQFEIFVTKIWNLGNLASNIITKKYDKEPLQIVVDNHDQYVIEDLFLRKKSKEEEKHIETAIRNETISGIMNKLEKNHKKAVAKKKDLEEEQLDFFDIIEKQQQKSRF